MTSWGSTLWALNQVGPFVWVVPTVSLTSASLSVTEYCTEDLRLLLHYGEYDAFIGYELQVTRSPVPRLISDSWYLWLFYTPIGVNEPGTLVPVYVDEWLRLYQHDQGSKRRPDYYAGLRWKTFTEETQQDASEAETL